MPNKVSVGCVLGACASAGILRIGKWLHSYTLRAGLDEDGIVGNAFIDMYSKCGAIGAALKIFYGLPCRDLVSWCTMIWGMASNGRPKNAIQLFSLMLCHGIQPDSVAFLGVLSACCHAGHVKEALMFFKAMYDVYGVLPEKEHYTCIIDMYGRAGCLREAKEFFHGMPMKPDKCVWGALLSACKLNGSNEAVHVRMQKMFLQERVALGGGTYAMLSNMFAKDERWDEANKVEEQLNARKISKLVGYSWTEVT
ncbi:hypothetical protein HPP92_020385 [Vanilla planifolia]|uniref:Pentatricopeptide repeat-containing protein n=1 Tax=Vanilla planifolia TaxID=51239 RepID=A0A835Q164_VANPL|nr:hypothetical protein HPP92_020385 [Vanilla planifolia]